MSGNGRRGRRGGRRQRRREEHARQGVVPPPVAKPNGQAGPGHPVLPAATLEPGEPPHPRPLSARELVARLEAAHALEVAAAAAAPADVPGVVEADPTASVQVGQDPEPAPAPRRFAARGSDWIAWVAGRGAGGTGRVAIARIGAIRFAPAEEPDRVTAEVIAPHARLDDLYDDELAELLERGLRYTKGNG